jgi:hypothetical protein
LEHRQSPARPLPTSAVIKHVIESDTWKLRHLAGPDAEPLLSRRAAVTDEEWIDFVELGAGAPQQAS